MCVAFARPLAAKGGCERFLLLRSRELGNEQSVTNGDFVFQECLCHGRYEFRESDATIDISLAFSRSGRDVSDCVGGFTEFQEGLETQSFLQRVDVLALQVLNLSLVLKEHSTTYTTAERCTTQNRYL